MDEEEKRVGFKIVSFTCFFVFIYLFYLFGLWNIRKQWLSHPYPSGTKGPRSILEPSHCLTIL